VQPHEPAEEPRLVLQGNADAIIRHFHAAHVSGHAEFLAGYQSHSPRSPDSLFFLDISVIMAISTATLSSKKACLAAMLA
jgi:hypothetical protein